MKTGNLGVGSRLTLAFTSLLLLMFAVVAVAWLALRDADRRAAEIAGTDLILLTAAGTMRSAQYEQAVAIREIVSNEDTAAQKIARAALAKARTSYAEAAATVEEKSASLRQVRVTEIASQLKAAQEPIAQGIDNAIDLVENAQYEEATSIVYKKVRPLQAEVAGQLEQLVALTTQLVQAEAQAANAAARRATYQMLGAFALAVLLGIGATVWLARGITRPLRHAMKATERVAAGDLTGNIVATSNDETGRLLSALAIMKGSLHDVAGRIRDGANAVNSASAEIEHGNRDLSRRTEEQASALEETVATLEEITSTVKQTAEHAKEASGLAARAAGAATDGGRMVREMVQAMGAIESSSGRIAEIVSVIDGIAFQTNILALNAAVEAARAGEQGRGFAVVATEVRSLAHRSAEAAKEIKGLIGEGVARVSEGTRVADQVGRSVQEVIAAANDAAKLVAQISSATLEQRSGMEQIGKAMSQMDDFTQRNASLVQETSVATGALTERAQELVETVGRFRLEGSEQAAPVVQNAVAVEDKKAQVKRLPWR